jgi:hypothetical protein
VGAEIKPMMGKTAFFFKVLNLAPFSPCPHSAEIVICIHRVLQHLYKWKTFEEL